MNRIQLTRQFQLVGLISGEVYFESNERQELHRWLDKQFGATHPGTKKNQLIVPMPEAMKIISQK